jgi:hypothetical protein
MTTPGSNDFCWQAVVPLIVHPTKVTIIELLQLEQRPLSATRMSKRIDDPKLTVAQLHYHCETLLKAGVLRLEGTVPRGASNEKFYWFAPQEGSCG